MKNHAMQLLLPALTGLLLAASFPQFNQGYLAWVAFIPLLLFVFRAKSVAQALAGGFLAGILQLFPLLIWMPTVLAGYGGLPEALAWIAYSLTAAMLACYPAAVCAAVKFLMKRCGESCFLLFPLVWAVSEYAQSVSPFGGFPWLLTGYSQSGWLGLIQVADLAGVYGISFLIASVNTAAAWPCLRKTRRPAVWAPLVGAGIMVFGCLAYGEMSLRHWGKFRPAFQAAMLQGNLDIDDDQQVLMDKFQRGYVRMADSLGPPAPDLLVLPESPSPVSFENDPAYREMLESLAKRYSLGLVFNNISYRVVQGQERYFNSAYFLDAKGNLAGIYDKIHLVPFGEYIPLKKMFSFVETISKDVGSFAPGSDYRIVHVGQYPANAIICFEAAFPGLVRRFVREGSRLIVNLTNDRWYGNSSAPYQHLAIARWRAIENRRYLLRAANSGITAVIEPTGKIQSPTGILKEAVCRGGFAFIADQTPYTRYGDVFIFLCAIITVLAAIAGMRGSARDIGT